MRILIISLSGIGDTLLATPLIHELKELYPEAGLEALVLWPGAKDLLEGNPYLEAIHQKNLIEEPVRGSLLFLLKLRHRRYDLSINAHTQGRIHYRLVARIIRARARLSHEYEGFTFLDRWLVNRTIPQDYSRHCVENNLALLQLLDKAPRNDRHNLEIYLSPAEEQWALEFSRAHGLDTRHCLALHVGSGGTKNLSLKRWPLTHYIALLQRLARSHPEWPILLLGGPGEQVSHQHIQSKVPGSNLIIPNTTSLRQAAALLKHCQAFLSVDTALMHLAAAMRVPRQIVIEAPTLNPTNVPWRNPYRLVRNQAVGGRNLDYYRYDGKPIKGSREELIGLMESVSVDDVHEAVEEALR